MKKSINKDKVYIYSVFSVILFIILFTLIQSCKKLEIERVVILKTGEVFDITANSASIRGIILDVGEINITQYGHCWSTTKDPTINVETKTDLGIRYTKGSFNSDLTGLLPFTTYYIRAYTMSSLGITYGKVLYFTTNWQKSLGGSGYDWANSIQQTTDGGYIIAGVSVSNDGDVSGNHGSGDYWIVKLTSTGELDWQQSLGGSYDEFFHSVQQTADGGYIIAGWSYSNDGDVSGNHGDADYWIVKRYEN